MLFFKQILSSFFCIFLFIASAFSYAKPVLKPLPANIAETGSTIYDFTTQEFQSKDLKRSYQVWLGISKKHANQVLPAIFMLDGNSAMSYLNEDILTKLDQQQAPVLIAIGYKTDLPFDSSSRSIDYTPAENLNDILMPDPRNPSRLSGGSADFQKLIIEEIAPWVETHVKLDPNKRMIWGHSYGGLFVLDSLLMTDYFSHYFSASPSLSWANHRIIKKINSAIVKNKNQKNLYLMEGDTAFLEMMTQSSNYDADTIHYNREILAKFDQQGINAKFILYPNLKHGDVFKASLLDVLENKLY